MTTAPLPAPEDVVDDLITPRDLVRYAVSRFREAGLVFGHGATDAVDEAAFIVLEGLSLPVDRLDPFADARLTRFERLKLIDLVHARVVTRKPAAYLLGRTYIRGIPFRVDERVIVPRSYLGELLLGDHLIGDEHFLPDPGRSATCSTCAPAQAASPSSPRWCFRTPRLTP